MWEIREFYSTPTNNVVSLAGSLFGECQKALDHSKSDPVTLPCIKGRKEICHICLEIRSRLNPPCQSPAPPEVELSS